jgi:deoxyribodipyrimidine photolyase-related protein
LEVTLIFPHQLFEQHPALQKGRQVYLVEEWLFFKQYAFHQQKIVLHRASMQYYKELLLKKGFEVSYISSTAPECDIRKLITQLAQKGVTAIYYCDVVDHWLQKRIEKSCAQHQLQTTILRSPNFLNSMDEVDDYFSKKKHYFQTDFYTRQRKQRKILLEKDGSPLGGKWTFDAENRERFPKHTPAPLFKLPTENAYVADAKKYTHENCGENYGTLDGPLLSAVTHADANAWLHQFLEHRFKDFGRYEDAMVAKEDVLHHSVLTPMLILVCFHHKPSLMQLWLLQVNMMYRSIHLRVLLDKLWVGESSFVSFMKE